MTRNTGVPASGPSNALALRLSAAGVLFQSYAIARNVAGRASTAVLICCAATAVMGADLLPHGWTIMNGPPPTEAKTRLCLGGTSFASAFSYKRMTTSIDAADGTTCYERLRADLQRRLIYLDFDSGAGWRPSQSAGGAPVRCNTGNSYTQTYNPCTSRFFSEVTDAEGRSGYRNLNREEVAAALVKSGAVAALDQAVANEQARIEAVGYARYQAEYADATSLEKITAFEQRYHSFDRDGLVALLQPRKQQLLHERYLAAFATAGSSTALTAFIQAYAHDDPDTLVPQAQRKLAVEQAREKLQRQKEATAKVLEAQRADQRQRQATVRYCKDRLTMAYAALERERSIEAVSGVENLTAKRQAGEIIVSCQQTIGRGY